MWQRCHVLVADGVHLFRDTCNVYVLVHDRDAVLIDFGDGAVLDHLAEFGADRVTDVLVTHHHRDQVQGLHRAVAHGARIWVPPVERDLFDRVDHHWQQRPIRNYYDLRQDRFSLLEPVPVTGTVPEYRTRRFGGFDVTTVPTPGHTLGSVSYLVDVGGRRLAFTGDLIHSAGKVWSLAATQWSYTELEGVKATVLSLYDTPHASRTWSCPPTATRSRSPCPRSTCWSGGCVRSTTPATTGRGTREGSGTTRSRS